MFKVKFTVMWFVHEFQMTYPITFVWYELLQPLFYAVVDVQFEFALLHSLSSSDFLPNKMPQSGTKVLFTFGNHFLLHEYANYKVPSSAVQITLWKSRFSNDRHSTQSLSVTNYSGQLKRWVTICSIDTWNW